jgi:hypothetical protein
MRTSATLLALALTALAGCGKGAKGDCPQLDICGGNPAGDTPWKVVGYCQVDPVRPSQSEDVIDFQMSGQMLPMVAPPQASPTAATQTTSGDWCSSLVYTPTDTVSNVSLWHRGPEISSNPAKPSTIIFSKDGSYLTKLVLEVPISPAFVAQCPLVVPPEQDQTHFPHRCLVANGAVAPTCAKLTSALNDFYKPANNSVPPTFGNILCCDADDGGCDCTYSVNLQVDDSGTWAVDPNDSNTLLQDSTTLQFNGTTNSSQSTTTTLKSSFCAPGGSIQLSGYRGGSLSNVQGLRTLQLAPM